MDAYDFKTTLHMCDLVISRPEKKWARRIFLQDI